MQWPMFIHQEVDQFTVLLQIYGKCLIFAARFSFQDSGITKDNPAFSMINDSDEDVIYGSDEESKRPLNRTRNDDDSD